MSDGAPLGPSAPARLGTGNGPSAPARLGAVNGLRGVAILAVLWHHMAAMAVTPFGAGAVPLLGLHVSPLSLLWNGWLGVNLFFVLSGFVLALPYASGERSLGGRVDAVGFLRRRARRLLPLHALTALVAVFAVTPADLWSAEFFRELAGLATFTYVFGVWTFMPRQNPALWSLAVEVHVSLLFPALLYAARRQGAGRVLAATLAVSFAVRLIAVLTDTSPPGHLGLLKDSALGRLDDFAVGLWLAHRHAHGARLGPATAALACAASLGLAFVTAVCWDNVLAGTLPRAVSAFTNTGMQAATGLALVGLLSGARGFVALATARPLQLFGAMCYSLYLWHLLGSTHVRSTSWGLSDVPVYFGLVVALSALTYRYVEFPERSTRALFLDFPR